MTKTLSVPWMEYDDIREHANQFLSNYHPDLTFPVPIEEIAEFQLGLYFAPVPELMDLYDVDGFLSSDLTTIYIDEFIYLHRPNRSRFTVAHEIGHIVLHPQAYEAVTPNTPDEWKEYIKSMPDRTRRSMEWQSNCFGGLVLAPAAPLREQVRQNVLKLQKEEAHKVPESLAWEYIEEAVARHFGVSSEVVHRRIDFDNLRVDFEGYF